MMVWPSAMNPLPERDTLQIPAIRDGDGISVLSVETCAEPQASARDRQASAVNVSSSVPDWLGVRRCSLSMLRGRSKATARPRLRQPQLPGFCSASDYFWGGRRSVHHRTIAPGIENCPAVVVGGHEHPMGCSPTTARVKLLAVLGAGPALDPGIELRSARLGGERITSR
jgi:hypothetical protein